MSLLSKKFDTAPAPTAPSEAVSASCCRGFSRFVVAVLTLTMIGSLCVAAYFAGRSQAVPAAGGIPGLPVIHANSAVTSENYSVATGTVSEEADGLFVLDHNSGLLQCSVIYPRLGRFMGQFTVNVSDAIGAGGKDGSYMLVTGRADFPRASNNPVGSTIVYVLNTSTGNYASYYVPFARQAVTAGQAQQGILRLIATGTANPIIDRNALR